MASLKRGAGRGGGSARRSRWDQAINVAILAAVLFLVLSPTGGGLGRLLRTQYGEWRDGRRIDSMWQELVSTGSRIGESASPVADTIVVFIDYECPACRLIAPSVRQLVERRDIALVVRHFPNGLQHALAGKAATAAVCGERMGAFAAVHNTLLESDGWIVNGDWLDFARQHVGADSSRFVSCMSAPETADRVRTDSVLAARLGIRGTPVFVSRLGVYEGAGGFGTAVADLVGPSAESTVDSVPLRVPSPVTVFDSRDHPSARIAQLGRLRWGYLLSEDTAVLVDGPSFHFINFETGALHTVGRVGEGPGEFRLITQVVRSPNHLFAWDPLLGRLTQVSNTGQIVGTTALDIFATFDSPMAELVAVYDGGAAVVFQDGPAPLSASPEGRFRSRARYVEVDRDGQVGGVIAEVQGKELFGTGSQPSYSAVIFGNSVHATRLGEVLAVAQTDWGEVRLFGREGEVRRSIVLPPGPTAREEDIEAVRADLAERQRTMQVGLRNLLREAGLPVPDDRGKKARLPVNPATPPIDRLFADAMDRLWARRYYLPGRDSVEWYAWGSGDDEPAFRLQLDGETVLLDAHGDQLLLGRRDEMDVDYVLVTTSIAAQPSW